jgi:hypothetical protein
MIKDSLPKLALIGAAPKRSEGTADLPAGRQVAGIQMY